MVLFVVTISTATATMESSIDHANMHASFENVDEDGVSTFTMVDTFKYNNEMYLFVGQDIRDQNGQILSATWGSKILKEEDFQVKRNLQSATLTSDIVLTQWWPYYNDIILNDIEVMWKSSEKAVATNYNTNNPVYPKVRDIYINCEAITTGNIGNTTLGTTFHSYMEISMSTYKV